MRYSVDVGSLNVLSSQLLDAADRIRSHAARFNEGASPRMVDYGKLDSQGATAYAYGQLHGAMADQLNSTADQLEDRARMLADVAGAYSEADENAIAEASRSLS